MSNNDCPFDSLVCGISNSEVYCISCERNPRNQEEANKLLDNLSKGKLTVLKGNMEEETDDYCVDSVYEVIAGHFQALADLFHAMAEGKNE